MRTTIDIPEHDHRLFMNLARSQHTSLSKLLVGLARRGLDAPESEGDDNGKTHTVDPETGLRVFNSGDPVTIEDVKALEDD